MLNTVRAFAIRWLLEPGKKPKKHVIKILSAWIDAPDNPAFPTEGCTHRKFYNDKYENPIDCDDIITAKQSKKILGIKIYEDDNYIGGFAMVAPHNYYSDVYNSEGNPSSYHYGFKQVCAYDYPSAVAGYYNCAKSTEVCGYTQMTEPSGYFKNKYAEHGFTDPLPEFGGSEPGGIAHVQDPYNYDEDYDSVSYSAYKCITQAELLTPRIVIVNQYYLRIEPGFKYKLNYFWELVNLRKKSTNTWEKGPIEHSMIEELPYTYYVPYYVSKTATQNNHPDFADVDQYVTYDPETGRAIISGNGYFLHYVDGMTQSKLIEYNQKIRDTENYEVITGIDEN